MVEIITYSLYEDDNKSDKYYKDVSAFTDEVINKILESKDICEQDFKLFIAENHVEDSISSSEYSLQLLLLGVLWKNYINRAIILKKIPKVMIIKLSKLRQANNIKKIADFLEGF